MKILLVQTSWLGDTILSTPVIAGIKQIYPDAELWMLTTPLASALVKRDPLLAGVLTYDKRGRDSGLTGLFIKARNINQLKFDIAYSLHKSHRTALLLWRAGIPQRIGFSKAKLRFFYHQTRPRNPKDHDVIRNLSILSGEISPSELDKGLRLFAPDASELSREVREIRSGMHRYAILVPGSAWKTKMWQWEGFQHVAKHIIAKGLQVILLGALSEKPINDRVAQGLDVVNLAGRTDISEAMYVVKNSDLVVCNDSMALHLASAFNIPNVAIFCATSPKFGFGPWQNKAIVVERDDLDCKPCAPHGGLKCPTGTEACMRELSPENVVKAVDNLLDLK
jgi:heptosyltransferase-2